jgi:hypothetical protein
VSDCRFGLRRNFLCPTRKGSRSDHQDEGDLSKFGVVCWTVVIFDYFQSLFVCFRLAFLAKSKPCPGKALMHPRVRTFRPFTLRAPHLLRTLVQNPSSWVYRSHPSQTFRISSLRQQALAALISRAPTKATTTKSRHRHRTSHKHDRQSTRAPAKHRDLVSVQEDIRQPLSTDTTHLVQQAFPPLDIRKVVPDTRQHKLRRCSSNTNSTNLPTAPAPNTSTLHLTSSRRPITSPLPKRRCASPTTTPLLLLPAQEQNNPPTTNPSSYPIPTRCPQEERQRPRRRPP